MRVHQPKQTPEEPIQPPAPLFAAIEQAKIERLFAGEARATSQEAILRRQLEAAQAQLLRYASDLCRLSNRPDQRATQVGTHGDNHNDNTPNTRLMRPSRSRGDSERRVPPMVHEVGPPEVVSASEAFLRTLQLCRKVAVTDTTVLLHGETGTGKEVCAAVIHHASPRHNHRMVAVNCAALPETLLESELFGHEAGAFTGATHQKPGLFEAAQGGTLFLDEIGEMALPVQAKFLRVLEERRFHRVGGTRDIAVDVRVIAATNRDLAREVDAGRFRSDLYYRLNVVPIDIPPLRHRVADIPALVTHFIARTATRLSLPLPVMEEGVIDALLAHDWPGNVRELRNVVERLVVLCDSQRIRVGDLPANLMPAPTLDALNTLNQSDTNRPGTEAGGEEPGKVTSPQRGSRFDEHERSLILHAMNQAGWNQSAAARKLGVPRTTLRSMLQKHALRLPEKQPA